VTARADVAVVGAGVVGLAIARALAQAGREVFVLERERAIGVHTSSRNSEVIHAGIYYQPGSLKARLCVQGRRALYAYCQERAVPHARIGKVIVATAEEEIGALEKILALARASGVEDLEWLSAEELHRLEPEVRGVRGLLSPSTGIVDSHALMGSLLEEARRAGARLVLGTPVLGGRVEDHGVELALGGDEPSRVRFTSVVNSAGLWAPELARRLEGFPADAIPPQRYAKAHYFVLSGRSPFRHLVYPVPVPGGLGTHVTLDLAGQARFGPDVQWVEAVDYGFDESRDASFYASIRRYWPALADGALQPGYTGIRPKVSGPGEPAADFLVHGPEVHGVPGLVQLYGIESPGLTAALALADEVVPLAAR
jgi:L-2-hydroxyglutarate oxidase LhgO